MLANNSESEFRDIDYSSKKFDELNVTKCVFINVKFINVIFMNCVFKDCEFVDVDFSKSCMGAKFIACVFVNCIHEDIDVKSLITTNCKHITTTKRPSEIPAEYLPASKKIDTQDVVQTSSMEQLLSVIEEQFHTIIRCTDCLGYFYSLSQYNYHCSSFEFNNMKCADFKNGCSECKVKYRDVVKYIKHKCDVIDSDADDDDHKSEAIDITTSYLTDTCKILYQCSSCNKLFSDEISLKQHWEVHQKTDNRKTCLYCHIKCDISLYDRHIRVCKMRNFRSVVMRCYIKSGLPLPDEEEYYRVYVSRVILRHYNSDKIMLICIGCGTTYTSLTRCVTHLYEFNKHGLKCEDYKQCCPRCGYESASGMSTYIKHSIACNKSDLHKN